jgi:hypothetical protein
MEEKNPVLVVLAGLFKAVKTVFVGFVWFIIICCTLTKNR